MTILFEINDKLYIKNPDSSTLGKNIVLKSIELMADAGFEQFTFKKLAILLETKEASIYRYFENKHNLLLYIINWYWHYLNFLIELQNKTLENPTLQLKQIILILCGKLDESFYFQKGEFIKLQTIVIEEGAKVYLTKNVDIINEDEAYKPYKKLCATIADIISQIDSHYNYPKSFSSTLIEASHYQIFFAKHLPRLTDNKESNIENFVFQYLLNLTSRNLSISFVD
jgi:AcrR family transcriptional regulator